MSRLVWGGAESGTLRGDGDIIAQPTTPTVDATVAHSGAYAYKATATTAAMRATFPAADGSWFYARVWYRVDALPTAAVRIMVWYGNVNTSALAPRVTLQPNGQLLYDGASTPLLSPAVSANTWFCVEYALRGRLGIGYDMIYRLDGVTLGTGTSSTALTATGLPDTIRVGLPLDAASAPLTSVWFDDIAVNDDTGSAQNDFPGVDGKIVHLLPVSDSAVGADWKGNTLLAFSPGAYDCLDNRPIVNNVFGTGGSQVQARNAVANVTAPAADLDVTTAAYSSVLGVGDAVRVCQHRLWVADSSSTLQHQIAGRAVSNPAEAAETAYTTPVVAASTVLGTAWISGLGPLTYNPTVTKASGAVLRIGKRTATTDSVGCCYAALQVEYGPATTKQRFLAVA